MNIDFAVIADYAAVTGEGKLVIAGIFDRISSAELPAIHPTMYMAFRLEGDEGAPTNQSVTVRLIAPSGAEVIPPFEGEVRLLSIDPAVPPGAQFVLALPGVRFEQYGVHWVEIRVGGELLKTVALHVVRPSMATSTLVQ
jgi:hypothetical protein